MFLPLILSFASPRGRLARGPWLLRFALLGMTALAFGMLALAAAGNDGAAFVALAFLWCAGALAARRLHDTGRGRRTLLLMLVPALGAAWVAALLLRRGVPGANRYGDDPLERLDYLQVDIHR